MVLDGRLTELIDLRFSYSKNRYLTKVSFFLLLSWSVLHPTWYWVSIHVRWKKQKKLFKSIFLFHSKEPSDQRRVLMKKAVLIFDGHSEIVIDLTGKINKFSKTSDSQVYSRLWMNFPMGFQRKLGCVKRSNNNSERRRRVPRQAAILRATRHCQWIEILAVCLQRANQK